LPIDPSALPQPTKRKSVILNKLSRLASPASKSSGTRNNASHCTTNPSSPVTSTLSTLVVSSKAEIADPLLGAVAVGASNSANPTITSLAAYLTTLSNDQVFRQALPWKRFVRVRTDDLERVRVERALRRVRSDVAARITSPNTANVRMHNSSVLHDANRRGTDHEPREAGTHEQEDSLTQDTEPSPAHDNSEAPDSTSTSASARSMIEIEALARSHTLVNGVPPPPVNHVVDPIPSTPPPSRIPHSQSADPKAARLSSIYTPSATSVRIKTTSASASSTKDDSPVNPSRAKERGSCKVQVSDFEMMRVLGKGCAGKVLLVRHKSSSDLYALKAITKRHVLARQELQHTLTEQVVLRRMAAEGSDPFVVKLWWSFHDKENLYLVMVRLACTHTQCSEMRHANMYPDRTSILAEILRLNWHAGVALGATVPASMLPKLLRVSRACTPRVSSIVTSNQRISLLLPMGTSYSLILGSPRSSHVALRRIPRQVPSRSQERHTG
jgi:serum/glucocorticoid-regulated kinase 2